MTQKILATITWLFFSAAALNAWASEVDEALILETLDSWEQGWALGNAELAVTDYAEDAEWTDEFGHRFQGKQALREGLQELFGLDYVMLGIADGREFVEITYLSGDVALVRSKEVRVSQPTPAGQLVRDRHINHLRVYERRSGKWLVVSHIISQEQPRLLAPVTNNGKLYE